MKRPDPNDQSARGIVGEWADFPYHVVVAPGTGKFYPEATLLASPVGTTVVLNQLIGEIHVADGRWPVTSPVAGKVMGVLALAGQPVRKGTPLLWTSHVS